MRGGVVSGGVGRRGLARWWAGPDGCVPTGAGSGIGRAVSLRLAREGASVAVADVDEAGAGETLRALPAGEHQAARVDVGCARSVEELMRGLQVGAEWVG